MGVIHWTEEARKHVQPLSADELAEDKPRKTSYYWGQLRKKYRQQRERYVEGLATADADVKAWSEAADALLDDTAVPPESTPNEVATLLWLVAGHAGTTHARFMVQAFGLGRAVETWIAASELFVRRPSYRVKDQKGFTVQRRDEPQLLTQEGMLRNAIMRASSEDYAQARAAAAPAFESGTLQAKSAIVDRFPNEEAWVKTLADAYIEDTTGRYDWWTPSVLHGARISIDDAKRVTEKAGAGHGRLECILERHGEKALPFIYAVAETAKHTAHFDDMARVLACVDTDEAAQFIAKNIGKKAVRKRAVDYFLKYPDRASALEIYRKKKGRTARMALDLLDQSARASKALDVPEADASELPTILVAPPWAGGERPKRKAAAIKDLPAALPHEDRLHGKDYPKPNLSQHPMMTEAQGEDWLKKVAEVDRKKQWPRKVQLFYDNEEKLGVPPALRLKVWNEDLWPYKEHAHTAMTMIGENGMDALPGLLRWADANVPRQTHEYGLRPILESEIAALAPSVAFLLRKQNVNKIGRKWMRRFPEAAIAGLLPAAVGKKNTRRREVAEQALRWLVSIGFEERIRERAKELGKTGPDAIDEILGWDPLYDCPKKAPKLPTTYRPEGFVRPILKTGKALPLSAMRHLGEMLAFTPNDETYVGLDIVKELCTERSLAELAWSVASAWETAGGDKRQRWMYYSIVHLADDEVVRRTTPALKNPMIVDVLGHIPTEAAAMELATIAFRGAKSSSVYNSAQLAAENALDRLAEAQGLSRDDLDDLLTPSLGLDEKGTLLLDFGPRSFRVGFDEQLMPEIIDEKGNRRKVLPRGAKKDDPDKLAMAKVAWKELKEDVGAIAMFRIDALERAMLLNRRWSVANFRAYWAEHRLMMHLARRVVWAAHQPKKPAVLFRVAEDGTFADVNDDVIEIADEGEVKIGVAHPLRWPDDSLTTWRELFDDYELLQPFHQLDRPKPEIRDEDLDAMMIQRLKMGNSALARRGLEQCGYENTSGRQRKDLGDGHQVAVSLSWYQKGMRFQIEHLENGQQTPWRQAPDGKLLFVLDELGLLTADMDQNVSR